MSSLDFTISCTVTFFSKKRTNPPNLINGKYSPHIVVKGTEEHIKINFIMEDSVIVGAGLVKEIFQHGPHKKK